MKNKNKKQAQLIIALAIEILLLILVFIVLIAGVLSIFLPILPGLVLIGIATGIYTLLLKSGKGKIINKIHPYVLKFKNKILGLKISIKFMGLIKKIKQKKQEKVKEEILKHGLVLFGFNFALMLAFFFGLIGISILARLMKLPGLMIAFVPLLVIFLFAGFSAVVWYRFGQILGSRFKQRKILNTFLVVLISLLPLLAILILFSGIIGVAGGFIDTLLALAFLAFILMSVLSAALELLIVSMGVITTVK